MSIKAGDEVIPVSGAAAAVDLVIAWRFSGGNAKPGWPYRSRMPRLSCPSGAQRRQPAVRCRGAELYCRECAAENGWTQGGTTDVN